MCNETGQLCHGLSIKYDKMGLVIYTKVLRVEPKKHYMFDLWTEIIVNINTHMSWYLVESTTQSYFVL